MFYLMASAVFLITACKNEKQSKMVDVPDSKQKIKVQEVIEGNTYSYLKGTSNNKEIWVAIRKQPIKVGNTYYYAQGLEMKDFHSKELDRTFPSIYFLNSISGEPIAKNPHVSNSMNMKPNPVKVEVDLRLDKDFTSIKSIYKSKDKLSNSIIKVKGKVTKFNKNILNRNWIHIQDGSEFNGQFDLTITTNQAVSIGEVVEFQGTLVTDKDFGAGYKYDVILEGAKILNNNKSQ